MDFYLPSDITPPAVSIIVEGTATAGQQYSLLCTVVVGGGPTNDPVIEWLDPEGQPLSSEGEITVTTQPVIGGSSVTTYVLYFSPLRTSRGGVYTCQATVTSPFGTLQESGSDTSDVTVTSKPRTLPGDCPWNNVQ